MERLKKGATWIANGALWLFELGLVLGLGVLAWAQGKIDPKRGEEVLERIPGPDEIEEQELEEQLESLIKGSAEPCASSSSSEETCRECGEVHFAPPCSAEECTGRAIALCASCDEPICEEHFDPGFHACKECMSGAVKEALDELKQGGGGGGPRILILQRLVPVPVPVQGAIPISYN